MSVAQRLKKLASETAIYGISSVVGRLINFPLAFVYINVFDESDYGVVGLVYVAVIFLNILFTYGMEAAYMKFATDAGDGPGRQRVFSTVIWSLAGTTALFTLLILVFRDAFGDLVGVQAQWYHLLYLTAGILAFDTLAVVPFADLRLESRPWRFAALKLVNIGLNVGLNLVLIFALDWGIEAVFVANLAASGVTLVLLAPELLAKLRPVFDTSLWQNLVRFGLPFVPGGLAYMLADRVNVFFLEALSPADVVRLYGADIDVDRLATQAAEAGAAAEARLAGSGMSPVEMAAQIAEASDAAYSLYVVGVFLGVLKLSIAVVLFTQMFRFAWQPFFLQHAKDADAPRLFAKVFTVFTSVGLSITLAVSMFAQELASIPLPNGGTLIPKTYWIALPVLPLALLAYVAQGWYYTFSAGAYLKERTRYFIYCAVTGSAVSIALNSVLVPQFGMLGAVGSTCISFIGMALMLFALVQRVYPVPYEWGRVLTLVVLAAGLFATWALVPAAQIWWTEVAILAGFAIVGLVLIRAGANTRILPDATGTV